MRKLPSTPRRVKQKMYYAIPTGEEPIYETDDDGKIIYVIRGGEKIPKESGATRQGYTKPVEFYNSITGTLTADEMQAFGSEARGNAKMTYHREQYVFIPGTLIWKETPVKYLPDGMVDEKSADYRVVGVLTSGQHFWRCILTEIVKNHADQV